MATQLSVMVDTGVPLADALESIAEQSARPGMKALVGDICEMVKGGCEFSTALQKYPKIFGQLFIALMRASEVSGTMGVMLTRVSEYLQQERDTRKKIAGAMTYPICMLSFSVLVVVGLLTFVMPRFEKIYSGKGVLLPLPTRILLGLSGGIIHYWPFILVGVLGLVVGLVWYFRSAAGRRTIDAVRVYTPIVGGMYRKNYLARSLRTMATMISTGVSILEGLEITAAVVGNHYFARIWIAVGERIKEGANLSAELRECKLIPPSVTAMVAAGEKTGKLGPVMNRVAGFCEEDLGVAVKSVTTMIEPLMIIVMGFVIGGIAMALLLPIFSISKVVAH